MGINLYDNYIYYLPLSLTQLIVQPVWALGFTLHTCLLLYYYYSNLLIYKIHGVDMRLRCQVDLMN